MPGGKKRSHILKQTLFKVCFTFLLPPGIKRLSCSKTKVPPSSFFKLEFSLKIVLKYFHGCLTHRSNHPRCSIKKLLLKILLYSQENNFRTLGQGLHVCNFIKKRLQHRCFPVNIAKFLRTSILNNICEQLLLKSFKRHV